MATSPNVAASLADRLVAQLRSIESCAVAFSGGVDSAVVAKAAHLALGDRAIAVTAVSASLAEGERETASELARLIGIRHELVHTGELTNPAYVRNAPDRCFHCKDELYSHLQEIAERFGVTTFANGANADDASDYRPGMQAAREHAVRSPLAECGMTKEQVRALARHWDLPVWDKPAAPCLSSRIAYGEEVTPERLRMIDEAEQFLRALGLATVRVRYHRGDLARLEVPLEAVSRLCQEPLRGQIVAHLAKLGFKFVTLDLEGFRSGSLNALVPVESLRSARLK